MLRRSCEAVAAPSLLSAGGDARELPGRLAHHHLAMESGRAVWGLDPGRGQLVGEAPRSRRAIRDRSQCYMRAARRPSTFDGLAPRGGDARSEQVDLAAHAGPRLTLGIPSSRHRRALVARVAQTQRRTRDLYATYGAPNLPSRYRSSRVMTNTLMKRTRMGSKSNGHIVLAQKATPTYVIAKAT
jgi:hypothetical protein